MKKLLILDTYNFLHRAYHALPPTFRSADGEPTNALYGVTSMLINMLTQIKPDYVIAAADGSETTFRSENFTAYKAQRKPMESDLESQIPKVIDMLSAFGIRVIQIDGYEADDIIATATLKFSPKTDVIVASNDKDLWQLAGEHTMILLPDTKGNTNWLGRNEVVARLGFPPEKIADYKGLRGDPSDNIPGVFGIGDKTAVKLLEEFASVEDIFKNIDKVEPESLREKLLNNYEMALTSKKLATLIFDVPVHMELEEFKYNGYEKQEVYEELKKYNFKSLLKRLGFEVDSKTKQKEIDENQLGLF